MAHSKEVQQEAIRLHSQNWHVQDISKKLNVPLRTIQRWISKSKNEDYQQEQPNEIKIQDTASFQNEDAIELTLNSEWSTVAPQISIEQSIISRNIVLRSYNGFLEALAEGDMRKVQILSNCIDKHSSNLYRSLSLEYLDINRSIEKCLKYKIDLDEFSDT